MCKNAADTWDMYAAYSYNQEKSTFELWPRIPGNNGLTFHQEWWESLPPFSEFRSKR